MKICYFNDHRLGVIKGDQVVDVTDAVKDIPHLHNRDLIIGLIERWDSHKAKLEKAAAEGKGITLLHHLRWSGKEAQQNFLEHST